MPAVAARWSEYSDAPIGGPVSGENVTLRDERGVGSLSMVYRVPVRLWSLNVHDKPKLSDCRDETLGKIHVRRTSDDVKALCGLAAIGELSDPVA